MWNYFGQKSTKVLLAFLLLAGAGGIIIASYNNGNETNTNINQVESNDEEISDDTLKDEDAGVENTYADPQGVSESSGAQSGQESNWYTEEGATNNSTAINANSVVGVSNDSPKEEKTTIKNESQPAISNSELSKVTKEAESTEATIAAVVKAVKRVAVNEAKTVNVVDGTNKVEGATTTNVVDKVEGTTTTNAVDKVDSADEVNGTNEADSANKTDGTDKADNANKDELSDADINNKVEGANTDNVVVDNPQANEESSKNTAEEEARIRLEEEQAKANAEKQKQEQASHPEVYAGQENDKVYNTYPWQTDCPLKKDQFLTTINGIKVGGYVCECVSYVGWKAFEAYGLYLGWGNAYSWDDRARANGYVVDHTPAAKTIGQIDSGTYGHVFWVEKVNKDGSINVTEYNNAYATKLLTGYSYYYDYGARTISASEARQYNYIHLHK